jgi:predicted helicase
LGETKEGESLFSEIFPQNSRRVQEQQKTPLRVIIGNPPSSIGQRSANDNAQNQSYPKLEARIEETYVKYSTATLSKSVYDSYVKALRWSADRIDSKKGGVIAFITNSGWLDKGSADGMRKCFENEFSSIYIFNLRGAIKGKSGESAKREGQNVFDIMTGVAITIFIKNPCKKQGEARIYYKDIGDYLSRKEKFKILKSATSIVSEKLEMRKIIPNDKYDWINLRSSLFESLLSLEPEKKFDSSSNSFFNTYSLGIATNKDIWLYNFSSSVLFSNVTTMVKFYNSQRLDYHNQTKKKKAKEFVCYDLTKISWTDMFLKDLEYNIEYKVDKEKIGISIYRPFVKSYFWYEKQFIQRTYQQTKLFPTWNHSNMLICVSGLNTRLDNTSVYIVNVLVDLNCLDAGTQCFPLYWYEKKERRQGGLFEQVEDEYIRHDAISDFILEQAKTRYGPRMTKEDIFYYVYGILHSPEYRKTFANDLKKTLPRLPLVEKPSDFRAFSEAGRKLAELHLNYEEQSKPAGVRISGEEKNNFIVDKMRFETQKWGSEKWGDGKKWGNTNKEVILYNAYITISNIPAKVYDYIVNGKSAVEWVMERYAITTHKESGIKNDPNDWAAEHGNPRYILDLLLSVITVSIKTVDIVAGFPKVEWK